MLASMVNDFANASPVRVPNLVRQDFGEGWAALHEAGSAAWPAPSARGDGLAALGSLALPAR